MKTGIFNINISSGEKPEMKATLSFRPFFQTLRNRINNEGTIRTEFFKYILGKYEQDMQASADLKIEDTEKYLEIMEFIYATVSPLLNDDKKSYWALATPIPNEIFYSTNSFYDLFPACCSVHTSTTFNTPVYQSTLEEFVYRLILESVYKFPSFFKNQAVYSYSHPHTGLTKYYQINIDTRFIDIHVDGELPKLDFNAIKPYLDEGTGREVLKKILPLDLFSFDGFSIITLEDVTPAQTLENIRTAISTNSTPESDLYKSVIQSLKSLIEEPSVEFGLLPFLKINDRVTINTRVSEHSILGRSALSQEGSGNHFNGLIDQYLSSPKAAFFHNISDKNQEEYYFLKLIKDSGIQSYAILPVYFNQKLAGIVEVYSSSGTILFEKVLSRLDAAIPFLAQLLQHSIDDFNNRIETVIKEKFTSLQPAVQWKFKEVAWKYLIRNTEGQKIENVTFKNVFPLYGAIDIRNSTIERNKALQEDVRLNLSSLITTLTSLRSLIHLSLTDELIFKAEKWLIKIAYPVTPNDEISLTYFFEKEVKPFLLHFKENAPQAEQKILEYLDATDETTGVAYAKRRNLETSIQLVNTTINSYFENAQDELQQPYPCYFEKFRTDGIEYDIYVGQSIAPERPFHALFLKNLRLWQLKAMIEITRLTHSILPQMPTKLETTQLIFVHGSTIDISFRNDERRFDVEGAYNIRYEVIKKRIDKVTVRNTAERLTQPGKIALVYFDRTEADEYLRYIQYLQEQKLLNDDLEDLDLEELQGVTGLKAFRVGVNLKDSGQTVDALTSSIRYST